MAPTLAMLNDIRPSYEYILWSGPLARIAWAMVKSYCTQMRLEFPLTDGAPGGVYHGTGLYGVYMYLQNMTSYTEEFYLVSSIMIETLWVLYADYKRLTERYVALRRIIPGGESTGMTDFEIDIWPYVLRAKIHHAMAKMATTLPITLREAHKRTVDADTGKQQYDQRQRALWPTAVYSQELPQSLLKSYRRYWLNTPVICLKGTTIQTAPFQPHDYPP